MARSLPGNPAVLDGAVLVGAVVARAGNFTTGSVLSEHAGAVVVVAGNRAVGAVLVGAGDRALRAAC